MTKLNQEQIKNVLGRIPYGKRQGECLRCSQLYPEYIDLKTKEFVENAVCGKCEERFSN